MVDKFASLGVTIDSSGADKGKVSLNEFAASAERADVAEGKLAATSRATTAAIAGQAAATQAASQGLSALAASAVEVDRAEAAAQSRIKAMVAASLEQQRAASASASATRDIAKAQQEATRVPLQTPAARGVRDDTLAASFASSQALLTQLDTTMASQAKTLEELALKRKVVSDAYNAGLISIKDTEDRYKALNIQEVALKRSASAHADEVQKLLKAVDPAGQALAALAKQEALLTEAFRVGDVTQSQYIKGIASIANNRAKWEAEAAAVNDLDGKLKGISLTSSFALREYTAMANGFARGNLGQVAREAGTLAVRGQLLGTVFSPLGLTIGGVALALGAYTVAMIAASRENTAFNNSLIFTGNAAGTTAGELQLMAAEIGKSTGNQHEASAALAALAATGQVASDNLKEFAGIAVGLEKVGGPAIAETAKQFAELGKEPVQATIKLNEQYHYLTAGVYEQIVALQKQGDINAAGDAAQKAFADAQKQRTQEAIANLHGVELAWARIKDGAGVALDAILNAGRTAGPDVRLAQLQKFRGDRELGSGYSTQLPGLEAIQRANDKLEKTLEEQVDIQHTQAELQAEAADAVERQILADKRLNEVLNARLARDVQVQSARLGTKQSGIRDQLNTDLTAYSAYQSSLDALHSAGLIEDEKFYAARRDIITKDTAARISALQQENAVIRQQDALQRTAAKAQIANLIGPDQQAARIKVQADADAKTIASQQRIRDNETAMFGVRQQSSAQIAQLSIEQVAAAKTLDQYNVSLKQQSALLDLSVDQRDIEAQVLARQQQLKDRGHIQSAQEEVDLRATLKALQDKNKATAAEDQLLANSVDQRRAYLIQLEAIQKLQSDPKSGFTRTDAKQATVGLIGPDVLRGTRVAAEANVAVYKNMYAQINAAQKANLLSEQDAAKARLNIAMMERAARLGVVQDMLSGLAQLQSSSSRRAFEIGKAAAIANATISAGTAIANAYATQPWYLGLAQGVAAAAILYSQIDQIKNTQFQGYMAGGYTGDGPTNEVAGVTHGKEFVLNAAATSRIGVAKLDALNAGTLQTSNLAHGAANDSRWSHQPSFTFVDQSTRVNPVKMEAQITANEVRVIAKDVVSTDAPKIVATQLSRPNSKISKSLNANTQTARRRSS